MTAMFTSPIPSQSSQVSRRFRTISAQFGDGYRLDAPDGINYQLDSWNLTFENLNSTDTTTVRTFFDGVGPFTQFTWTAPGDTSKTWKMDPKGYSVTPKGGSIYTIQVTINQAF